MPDLRESKRTDEAEQAVLAAVSLAGTDGVLQILSDLYKRAGDQPILTGVDRGTMISALVDDCHSASLRAGWYRDPTTGEPIERNIPEMLCLIHSEISEAMEAYRKDQMDDNLPDFHGTIVELVDSLIRHFDLLGYLRRRLADEYSPHELDSGAAFVAKREFNDGRADHKPENRAKPGGKKF